ncbi:DNA-directed RNA polymerases I, II, and III subunit RPABC2 isoform X2 [Macaca nemestrina]|uniref:DNA-directed RNA polymerases I, II, and III subunit RPABC2 isoform X2 n=1 Tax=Macaca nemestrina TaxID=9545 RepID=UPI0039B86AD6
MMDSRPRSHPGTGRDGLRDLAVQALSVPSLLPTFRRGLEPLAPAPMGLNLSLSLSAPSCFPSEAENGSLVTNMASGHWVMRSLFSRSATKGPFVPLPAPLAGSSRPPTHPNSLLPTPPAPAPRGCALTVAATAPSLSRRLHWRPPSCEWPSGRLRLSWGSRGRGGRGGRLGPHRTSLTHLTPPREWHDPWVSSLRARPRPCTGQVAALRHFPRPLLPGSGSRLTTEWTALGGPPLGPSPSRKSPLCTRSHPREAQDGAVPETKPKTNCTGIFGNRNTTCPRWECQEASQRSVCPPGTQYLSTVPAHVPSQPCKEAAAQRGVTHLRPRGQCVVDGSTWNARASRISREALEPLYNTDMTPMGCLLKDTRVLCWLGGCDDFMQMAAALV